MEELTNKQFEVLCCIADFIEVHGYSPSVRDLGKLLNLASTATVHAHLKQLVNKGFISYVPNQFRTIRIIKEFEKE